MAKSELVDAVYIATPHPFHKECAELFLNAGKHVLCEKPLCVNEKQAKELKACAEKNKVFLMEAMWTRFLPAIIEAQEIVKSGKIGKVLGVSADFCYAIEPEEDPKVFKNEMAGGSLLDVGAYGIHFASLFLGSDPEKIVSVADVKDGADIHTNLLLKYKNGAIANITSAIGVQKPATACVFGSKGQILIPEFYSATELFVSTGDEENYIAEDCIGDGFEEEIIEVCECIQNGKTQSDVLPLDESIKILKIMDTVREQIGVKYPLDGE